MGLGLTVKLGIISTKLEKDSTKLKSNKLCVCGKKRHKSEGAAKAHIRGLLKLQDLEDGIKDLKNTNKLHAYRSRSCERVQRDEKEAWHVGHR